MYKSLQKILIAILYSFIIFNITFANTIRDLQFLNSNNSSHSLKPRNNKNVFKITYIYNSDSNLCLTYNNKVGNRVALKPCTQDKYQQWYVPTEGASYWILAPTLSFYSNPNTMNQFEVDNNTIQNNFNANTICLSVKPTGIIQTNYCIQGNVIIASIMDPVSSTNTQNLIKSSEINNSLCLDIFADDISFYKNYKEKTKISQMYHVNPNTLQTKVIRCNMNQCSNNINTSSQYFNVFNNYADLVSYQNSIYNQNNYQSITSVKVNRKNIFLKVGEVKNINMEIFAENTHIATINENDKSGLTIRSLNKKTSDVSIIGSSIGNTALTVNIHDKTVKLNVIVDDNTDKITFLDIQTFKDNIGDAIIIQSTDTTGKPIYAMIDVGKKSDVSTAKLLAYLKDNNIFRLEWILISHFHGDHVGGFAKLFESGINIGAIFMKKYGNLDTKLNSMKGKTAKEIRAARLNEWNDMINLIKTKNIPICYISPNRNDHTDLGNYHFKFFNIEEAFTNYDAACIKFKNCNENTNSIIAVIENNGKYYYLNGDIDTFPGNFANSKDNNLKKAYQD
eukprot:jgi/Orpsp1_1/1177024/evm.model.c7180000059879.1